MELSFFSSFILGIIEGLTEFLPVSSTGHMILTSYFLKINQESDILKTFEVVIQLGAILAISIVYRARIFSMFRFDFTKFNIVHVFLGISPALLVALFFRDFIKSLFDLKVVLAALIVGGIYMMIAEYLSKNRLKPVSFSMDEISYRQAFCVGLFQIISVIWPGFSRAGSSIAGGLFMRISYRASTDFSFFMAIPIMCAAAGYEILKSYKILTTEVWGIFAVGFVTAFIIAYLVVKVFLKWIQKVTLTHFAIYRFIIAILIWIFL